MLKYHSKINHVCLMSCLYLKDTLVSSTNQKYDTNICNSTFYSPKTTVLFTCLVFSVT